MHRIQATPSVPAHPVQPAPFSMGRSLRGIRFESVRNERSPTFTYYRLPTPCGAYHRRALGHATSVAYDLLAEERGLVSRGDAKAINRTMAWLAPVSVDQLGVRVLNCFTYLGAMRAGAGALLEQDPADREVAKAIRDINDSIVSLAVKAGRCDIAPDGFYHGTKKTEKVAKAAMGAEAAKVRTAMSIGGQKLFDGIAQALVARPLLDSLAERDPQQAVMFGDGSTQQPDIMFCLHPGYTASSEGAIRLNLEIGNEDQLTEGVFELLRMPEFVMTKAPATAGSPVAMT